MGNRATLTSSRFLTGAGGATTVDPTKQVARNTAEQKKLQADTNKLLQRAVDALTAKAGALARQLVG